jgi:hypothetical protein
VAPGEARGHVVYSQDETRHAAGPATYRLMLDLPRVRTGSMEQAVAVLAARRA